MRNKITALLALFAIATQTAQAAKITQDTLVIGKPGSSSNKDIPLGTGVPRSNPSQSKLQFAHDGASFSNVGSGAGSAGRNYLESNPDAEATTVGWSTY